MNKKVQKTMNFSTPECLLWLKANYSSLNPATKKVADYIFKDPYSVIENNIVDLAKKIGVSQFSIITCIKVIGYNGYKDFRVNIAKELANNTNMLFFEDITPNDDSYTILAKVTRKKINCLNDTLKLIKPEAFERAVEIISKSKRIEIYGIGYSAFAAENAQMNFRRLNKDCICYRDPHYQKMSASLLKKGDTAIGITTSGATESVVKSLEIAKECKATTIAITANSNSPITKFADVTLVTTFSEPLILRETNSSNVEQFTIVSALTLALAAKDYKHSFISLSESSKVIKNI